MFINVGNPVVGGGVAFIASELSFSSINMVLRQLNLIPTFTFFSHDLYKPSPCLLNLGKKKKIQKKTKVHKLKQGRLKVELN